MNTKGAIFGRIVFLSAILVCGAAFAQEPAKMTAAQRKTGELIGALLDAETGYHDLIRTTVRTRLEEDPAKHDELEKASQAAAKRFQDQLQRAVDLVGKAKGNERLDYLTLVDERREALARNLDRMGGTAPDPAATKPQITISASSTPAEQARDETAGLLTIYNVLVKATQEEMKAKQPGKRGKL